MRWREKIGQLERLSATRANVANSGRGSVLATFVGHPMATFVGHPCDCKRFASLVPQQVQSRHVERHLGGPALDFGPGSDPAKRLGDYSAFPRQPRKD